MSDTTVVPLRHRDTIEDPLTAVLRSGAHRLLAQAGGAEAEAFPAERRGRGAAVRSGAPGWRARAVGAEAGAFLAEMKGVRLPDGRERLVRHGHGPERLVQTGIGPGPPRGGRDPAR